MKTKVKICGIRTAEHAQAAIDAGADFLGFVFVRDTKDFILPKVAKEILIKLRMNNGQLTSKFVGVFLNQPVEEVNEIANFLGLDFVQLHGEESVDYMSKINRKIIKKITDMVHCDILDNHKGYPSYFLLDRKIQGEGEMVNIVKAKVIAEKFPVFFAGGLTPENVSMVVSNVNPFAVDVCSGVMTNHVGDPEKIKQFIQRVKGVQI